MQQRSDRGEQTPSCADLEARGVRGARRAVKAAEEFERPVDEVYAHWPGHRTSVATACIRRPSRHVDSNTRSANLSPMPLDATILHADLDAFYASVEQVLDPSLLGRPIAVGGGVVLAASYEAKAFGIHAGMPGWRARRLCPTVTFTGGPFREYQRLGDAVIEVLHDFTPFVERISIDEAFLDVSGAVHLFGSPAHIAGAIRRRVRDELRLPISVGVAT